MLYKWRMKKVSVALLSLAFSSASFAYQGMQCEAVDNREQTAFVLALGHEGENTLYVASPLLYPATERSELITVIPSTSQDLQIWKGSDKYYRYTVTFNQRVNGQNVDAFGAIFEIVGAKTGGSLAQLPMTCFNRVHAD